MEVMMVGNPLLSERDGNIACAHGSNLFNTFVGNPLLSERDGNNKALRSTAVGSIHSRKPTTLWKRWKLRTWSSIPSPEIISSETHYSLKEMETFKRFFQFLCCFLTVSETHYSLKEMETSESFLRFFVVGIVSETHYSLKEMETAQSQSKYIFSYSLSETHYSLKEMETETRSAKAMSSMLNRRKPTTLWKRWKLDTTIIPSYQFFSTSETYYSLKEMETFNKKLSINTFKK